MGDVVIGAGAYIDHHVIIASAGPRVRIGAQAVILAGSVVRSVGGTTRPAFVVDIGCGTLVAPQCVITGCTIGSNCYVATGAIILQGASIGSHSRLALGSIVHAGAKIPAGGHLGLRHVAVSSPEGYSSSHGVDAARATLNAPDFFNLAFDEQPADQAELHRAVIERVRAEVLSWTDEPLNDVGSCS